MSMPKPPEVDPELTCAHALNMLLSSIAMEELALSHIVDAESEKLQYVLGKLEASRCMELTIDEILSVNESVTCLLDSVSQNQMILKSKMDKALYALEKVCPGPPKPPCPPGPIWPACVCCHKCSALFKAPERCQTWYAGSALQWKAEPISGDCACIDPCDKTKIELGLSGRIMVNAAVNVRTRLKCKSDAAISLQLITNSQHTDIYTVYGYITDDRISTIAISGIIVEPCPHEPSSLSLKLISSDSLAVEDSMLSILEI